jgi:hypothetical protein
VEGYYDKHWPTGLWSTHANVEGTVLKAARYWGNNSSVVNAGIKSLRAMLSDNNFLLAIFLLEPCISLIYA